MDAKGGFKKSCARDGMKIYCLKTYDWVLFHSKINYVRNSIINIFKKLVKSTRYNTDRR